MTIAKPQYGQHIRVTFGKHAEKTGEIVSHTYPKEPGRPQPLVMVRLDGGGLVMVPVNDVEVTV